MASLGVRSVDELIGRTDLIETNGAVLPWKAASLDLSGVLFRPESKGAAQIRCKMGQDHGIKDLLDAKLIGL